MSEVSLNLVVLRSSDLERAAAFYSRLGLHFARHRHGSGPERLAAKLSDAVFELYPLAADGRSTAGTRIGLRVPSAAAAAAAANDGPNVVALSPRDSEWGRRAVVVDPDGHRVELTERRVVGPFDSSRDARNL